MPEYAEVETLALQLNKLFSGSRVEQAVEPHPAWAVQGDLSLVEGLEVESIDRWGKRLRFTFSQGPLLISSLGMTGSWSKDPPLNHLLLYLVTDRGKIFYSDPRRFGSASLFLSAAQAERQLGSRIGVDALASLSSDELRGIMNASSSLALKAALLDQSRLSGIGNYLADEICFAARINPTRPLLSLSDPEWLRLNRSRHTVIQRALRSQGASFSDYRHADGGLGSMQDMMKVYGKLGEACPNCSSEIVRVKVAGRSTHLCPSCQPSATSGI